MQGNFHKRPTGPPTAVMIYAAVLFLASTTFARAHAASLSSSSSSSSHQKRHVQLASPAPFEWAEYGPTNPLNPDGSDYPCKVPQEGGSDNSNSFRIVDGGAPTEMVHGQDYEIAFAGWAVHGGGSCQFALADGRAPTPDTPWRVVHSVQGGCPKAHVDGNLPTDEDPDTYSFRVPDDFAPGEYTFAWTWVNRIGGTPEFYMNCAPITVKAADGSGSSSSSSSSTNSTEAAAAQSRRRGSSKRGGRRASTEEYPDLFLANIGDASNGCTTEEAWAQQLAIQFPYPGASVSFPNGQDNLFQQPCDGNTRNTGATATGGGGGGGSQPTTTTTTRAVSAAASATSGNYRRGW